MVGWMAGGTVGGIVSLSARQTPIIHGNTPRAAVLSSIWGFWRVDKLTIPPTALPTIPRPPSRPSLRAILPLRGLTPYCVRASERAELEARRCARAGPSPPNIGHVLLEAKRLLGMVGRMVGGGGWGDGRGDSQLIHPPDPPR